MGNLTTNSNFGPEYNDGTTLRWVMAWAQSSPAQHEFFVFEAVTGAGATPKGRCEYLAEKADGAANIAAWRAFFSTNEDDWFDDQPAKVHTGLFNAAKKYYELTT